MAEVSEAPKGVEKDRGVVGRVTAKISKFLSENYTIKGAKAAEMRKYGALHASFTPSQQTEMRAYYEKKVSKKATWKVIRNWVVTGAGLALGWSVLQNPAAAWKFVTETVPTGVKAALDWVFRPMTLEISKGGLTLGPGLDPGTWNWALPKSAPPPLDIPFPTKILLKP